MKDGPRKLARQPLTLVLAEIRYSDVLLIGEHIPAIQEELRKEYPIFKKAEQQSVNVAEQSINVSQSSQWFFTSQDQRSTVIVGHDRLVFITSNYDRFPDFSRRCLAALNVLEKVVCPSLLISIGLRYNDRVVTDDPADLKKCLHPQVLPDEKFAKLGLHLHHHRIETGIETAEGNLAIRSLAGKHGFAVMPDLGKNLLVKIDHDKNMHEVAVLLDFDHIWQAKSPGEAFELGLAETRLSALHEITRSAFWAATTKYARNELWS